MSIESITIPVEPEVENLSKIHVEPISKCDSILKGIHGQIMFSSLKPNQKIILEYEKHPVFDGFVSAYKDHRPITISPDIIWLLIIQAFSNHVSANPEKYRKMFVNFNGKKNILLKRLDKDFSQLTSKDWEEEFIPEFVQQISEHTGKEIVDTLTPNFTTTTPVSLAVGQLTIMSTMKHFFNFELQVAGCGFPRITIEGTIKDWTNIKEKLTNLTKYDFGWFTEKTIPIIKKIINTKKGKVDTDFWKQMLRIKDSRGYYDPSGIDGWIVSFFPFDENGDRIYEMVPFDVKPQSEIQKIPFKLDIVGVKTMDCLFLAGFVGLTQNKESGSIKPEIGWFVTENVNCGFCFGEESFGKDGTEKEFENGENINEKVTESNHSGDDNVNDSCCLIN